MIFVRWMKTIFTFIRILSGVLSDWKKYETENVWDGPIHNWNNRMILVLLISDTRTIWGEHRLYLKTGLKSRLTRQFGGSNMSWDTKIYHIFVPLVSKGLGINEECWIFGHSLFYLSLAFLFWWLFSYTLLLKLYFDRVVRILWQPRVGSRRPKSPISWSNKNVFSFF